MFYRSGVKTICMCLQGPTECGNLSVCWYRSFSVGPIDTFTHFGLRSLQLCEKWSFLLFQVFIRAAQSSTSCELLLKVVWLPVCDGGRADGGKVCSWTHSAAVWWITLFSSWTDQKHKELDGLINHPIVLMPDSFWSLVTEKQEAS